MEAGFAFLAVQALNALSYGLLLYMLAAGLTVVFSLMGVLNFAHAGFFMLGAYLGWQIGAWTDFWTALVAAPLAVGALGMAVERFGLRAARRHGHVAELLLTFGVAIMIDEAVQLVWGRSALDYRPPPALDGTLFTVFGAPWPAYRVFMMLAALAMLALVWLALARTRAGLIVRAARTQPAMLEALGHDLPTVHMLVFGGGAALAALAGTIGGALLVTDPGMALAVGPIVFVIIVIGGLGSLAGAFAASLIVGFAQTFAVALDLPLGGGVTLAQLAPVLPYLLMVAMLIARPRGLAGRREH